MPSVLVKYQLVIRSASSSPPSSGCRHAHMCQASPSRCTTTSFHAVAASPGSTTLRAPSARSTASTHQCFDCQVEQLTYTRQPPSASGTSAGRSSDAELNESLVTVSTVSK